MIISLQQKNLMNQIKKVVFAFQFLFQLIFIYKKIAE